jgi:hypothetical protein
MGALSGLLLVNGAYRSASSAQGTVSLAGTATVTGDHEVTIDVTWRWPIENPHPGVADEIVILGSDEWGTARDSINRPTSDGSVSKVEFWTQYGGADLSALFETDEVKAYAAVAPNREGHITICLSTEGDAARTRDSFAAVYMMVDCYPRPRGHAAEYPMTLAERLMMAVGIPSRIRVSNTSVPIGLNASTKAIAWYGIPTYIKELLPDTEVWLLWSLSDLRNGLGTLGRNTGEDLIRRTKLERVMLSTRQSYGCYGEPRVLVAAGDKAVVVYEDTDKLIMIPLAWTGSNWSEASAVSVSKK